MYETYNVCVVCLWHLFGHLEKSDKFISKDDEFYFERGSIIMRLSRRKFARLFLASVAFLADGRSTRSTLREASEVHTSHFASSVCCAIAATPRNAAGKVLQTRRNEVNIRRVGEDIFRARVKITKLALHAL